VRRGVINPSPILSLGGLWYHFGCVSSFERSGMRNLINSYATGGTDLRIMWPLKSHYDAKVHLYFVRDTKNIFKILKIVSRGSDAYSLFFLLLTHV
jgi:hypothetical protein